MTSRLSALCFKASDPQPLANFWATALNWEIKRDKNPDTIRLVPTDGTRFDILFHRSAQQKEGKNPIHIDLATKSLDDQAEMVRKLVEHGAHHIDIGQSPDQPHVVLADPEGNEFCVVGPDNAFVDRLGRLGSITCDGSRLVGLFWSQAFGWPLVWDKNEETAIRAADSTGPFITWGPPLPTNSRCQLYFEITSSADSDQQAEIDRLISLGAHQIDVGKADTKRIVMADPDGILFIFLDSL